MAKRLSGFDMTDMDVLGDGKRLPPKRPKIFTHETEQFPLCSSVFELEMHTLQAQNKKLVDGLLQRQQLEEHLRQRMEKLEARKLQSDKVLLSFARCWKQLVRSVLLNIQRGEDDNFTAGADFFMANDDRSILDELYAMDEADVDPTLHSWSRTTDALIGQLVHRFSTLQRDHQATDRLLEELQKGSLCNGHGSEQCASKLADLLGKRDLVCENATLRQQLDQMQARHIDYKVQISDLVDQVAVLSAEATELRNRVADAEAKNEQWVCKEEKCKIRVHDLTERLRLAEYQIDCAVVSTPDVGSSLNNVNNGPIETAPTTSETCADVPSSSATSSVNAGSSEVLESDGVEDAADKKDLAEIRLSEVRALTKQLLAAQENIDTLRYQLNHVPDSVLKETPLYRGKCYQLRALVVELNRTAQYNRCAKRQFKLMFDKYEEFVEKFQSELMNKCEDIVQAMQKQTDDCNGLLNGLMVRLDEKQQQQQTESNETASEQGSTAADPETKENKVDSPVMSTLKRQLKQLRGENSRWRKKFDETAAQVVELSNRLEQEYLKIRNSIVIPMENGCADGEDPQQHRSADDDDSKEPGELEESDVEDEKMKSKEPMARISDLKKRLLRYKRTCRKLTAAVEARSLSGRKKDMADKLAKVMTENRRLKRFVRSCSSRGAQETTTSVSELERMNKFYEDEIVRLRRKIEECKKEEQTVLVEAESTGQAYDQALEENCSLQEQLAQAEASITKHIMTAGRTAAVMDTIFEQLTEAKLQLKLMEEKLSLDEKKLQLYRECDGVRDTMVKNLQRENELLAERYEQQTWTTLDVTGTALTLNKAVSAVQNELDLLKELDKKKNEMLEAEHESRAQLEEQLQLTRKRLERMKRCSAAAAAAAAAAAVTTGSSRNFSQDEVLCEENRHLKELLTCPSCKVNRKDATLAKCFHVFCSPCLKKRYETRQRKCPKCAQTFGANDIKRIFI